MSGTWASYNSSNLTSIGDNVERARKIIYKYSKNLWDDDMEIDLTGELTFKQGDIISRRGRNWKINSVHEEDFVDDQRGMPTISVSLVDTRVH